ncbi:MAG TPA: hypothetical protein VG755_46220 [Nannocystaceae bacterium]|nr:hypothetical protein [Nannocystaceae bacterium]
MTEMRWAARYTFLDPLWRGRARLIVDPELEAVLRRLTDEPEGVADGDAPWRELLAALVPVERGVPVWMLVRGDELARSLAPHWPGTRFMSIASAEDLLERAPWELALVHLAEGVDDRQTEVVGSMVTRVEPSSSASLRRAGELLTELGSTIDRGRQVVVSTSGDDVDYDGFAQLVGDRLPGARIYGAYRPAMVAFVEFDDEADDEDGELRSGDAIAGELSDARTNVRMDSWDTGDDEEDEYGEEDAVPLSFDNTLVATEPSFGTWLAVAGDGVELAEGLTLVELPAAAEHEPAAGALRRQLHETRRLADLGALERQRQVERIDALTADNAALREAVTQLREQLAGALDPSAAAERLDAALAREQSLRWRVAALERELAELRVRPVDELEAELARLRAELAGRDEAPRDDRSADNPPQDGGDLRSAASSREDDEPAHRPAAPDAARRLAATRASSGRTAALRQVEGLVRRIERGRLVTGALRRELVALRRRLRS